MIACPSCAAENVDGTRFCVKCGTALPTAPAPESWRYSGELNQTQADQADRPSSGQYTPPYSQPPAYPDYSSQGLSYQQQGGSTNWQQMGADKKVAAGICGILLGGLGIHKFVLGYTMEGLIMLLVCIVGGILTCGLASMAVGIVGLVEGIIYLTKSDEEFVRTYVQNKRGWF